MANPLAAEPFWKILNKSGILPPEDAQALQREFGEQLADFDSAQKIAEELIAREVLTKWQADNLLKGKHRGFFLGPYRIQGVLGEGGMGKVFLAEHQMMRRLCAIKVLPPKQCQGNPSLVKRFYREAQAAAALDHPNIVRAYDVNKATLDETEVHYLVMEYVGGMDLQRRVDSQGVLGYSEAAKFIRQAAEGLSHAHDRGFVHRDIKPANLLIDSSGTLKILDLGLARFFDPISDASLSGEHGESLLGTADYLAPEQALNSHNVDVRADIYSLGQTCYFLLTGHAPFPTGTVAERLMAHQVKSPEPIERERPDVPLGLLTIIEKMTAKKPDARYQSSQEVAEVLDKWLNEEDEEDDLEGFAARFRQRHGSPRPSSHGPTQGLSAAAEETDLELAPLEDEKPAKTAGDSPAVSDSKAPSAPSNKPASQSGVRKTPAPKPKSGSAGAKTKSGSAGGKAKSGSTDAKTKGVAGLLDDLASVPDASGSHPGTPQGQQFYRPRRKSGLDKAINSPLFWIGLAATTAVLLIAMIVIASIRSESPTPSPPAIKATTEPNKTPGSDPTPSPETETPKQPTDVPQTAVPSRDPEQTTPPEKSATDVPKPSDPDPSVVTPKRPEDEQKTQPKEPAQSTPDKPLPVDPKALFADISEFSTELKSFDRDKDSTFHTVVNRLLDEAAGRADLTINKTEAAVMTITLSAPEEDEKIHFIISAVLKCRVPKDTKAKAVTVWEHKQELGVATKQFYKARGVPVRIIRPNIVKFFAQFANDYKQAKTATEKRSIP